MENFLDLLDLLDSKIHLANYLTVQMISLRLYRRRGYKHQLLDRMPLLDFEIVLDRQYPKSISWKRQKYQLLPLNHAK